MARSLLLQRSSDLPTDSGVPPATVQPSSIVIETEPSRAAPTDTGESRSSSNADTNANMAYTVREQPLGAPRHLRIVGIGAGASGINMIRTLRQHLQDYEHVVYEKNADVGGTWYVNRYPGCCCDVPSHSYQFSWAPNTAWSNFFSPADEIRSYLCRLCDSDRAGMRDLIKTEHEVVAATWHEAQGHWNLTVRRLATGETFDDYADFLIDASGILDNWKWPDIPGLHDFQGDLIHSARWPEKFDAKDKTVAVIGNGSSGVQIVPALQPQVKKLVHLVRSPTWIIPPRLQVFAMNPAVAKVLGEIQMDDEDNFTPEQVERFQADPALYRNFVKTIEKEVNNTLPILLKDSPMQAFAKQQVTRYMTAMLGGNEKLCQALIPDYALGCRRMTPAPRYLKALTQPNVDVLTGPLSRVVPQGIELASGETVAVDAIVCATGFDLSFCPRFPLVGRSGNLQDLWRAHTPQAYMSCAVPGMPNYFTFFGPNAPIGHGSVFTLSEHIATYIAKAIRKCQTEGIKAMAPSQAAVDDYNEHIRAFMPRTVWAGSCRSWFKGGGDEPGTGSHASVTALHPGSRMHFFHMLESLRGEDYEYVYDDAAVNGPDAKRNRFWYLGNGFSAKELDPTFDTTWYLDQQKPTTEAPQEEPSKAAI